MAHYQGLPLSPPPHRCQLASDRSTDAPLVGGQGSGQEGCPGGPAESLYPFKMPMGRAGGRKEARGPLLSPRDGLIRLSARRDPPSLYAHTHTHSDEKKYTHQSANGFLTQVNWFLILTNVVNALYRSCIYHVSALSIMTLIILLSFRDLTPHCAVLRPSRRRYVNT